VQEKANQQIEEGLRALRKQCKQLSKNQLITTLLQQIEQYSQLQGICQQILEENKKLKAAQAPEGNVNENSSNPA
jgi:type II secretory pathway component PulF